MWHMLRLGFGALLMLSAAASTAAAADEKVTVRVALLDMSSLMPNGMMGYGMMGPGMMMQGQGLGQISPGMGGYGMMGPGMMGQAMMGGMMSMRVDISSVKAGTVTFDITNWSRSVVHEMLIISVDNPSAPIPYDFVQARLPEEQVKVLGEAGDLQPNDSQAIEIVLTPGSYLLICNVPGHYAAGMVAPFNVAP